MKQLKIFFWVWMAWTLSGCVANVEQAQITEPSVKVTYKTSYIDSLSVKVDVSFKRNGEPVSYGIPFYRESERKYDADAILLKVELKEYGIQKRFLLVGSEKARLDLLPDADEVLITRVIKDGAVALPWAMVFEDLEQRPDVDFLEIELTAWLYEAGDQVGQESLSPSYDHTPHWSRFYLPPSVLKDLWVPHWWINESSELIKNKEVTAGEFVSRLNNIVKSTGFKQGDANQDTVGIDFSYNASRCFPEVIVGAKNRLFTRMGEGGVYSKPKPYRVGDEGLLHYLARQGKYLDSNTILALHGFCVDFFVTDEEGNTFLHNNVHRFHNADAMLNTMYSYYWRRICNELNNEGKNCFDKALDHGRPDLVIAALDKGLSTAYYQRHDVSKAADRGMPKQDYQRTVLSLAPVLKECEMLNEARRKISRFECSFRDKYGAWQRSERCENNQENAKNYLESASSRVCENWREQKTKAEAKFGPYERINFLKDLERSPAAEQFSRKFKDIYPITSVNLVDMLNDKQLQVKQDEQREKVRQQAYREQNWKANDQHRAALNGQFEQINKSARDAVIASALAESEVSLQNKATDSGQQSVPKAALANSKNPDKKSVSSVCETGRKRYTGEWKSPYLRGSEEALASALDAGLRGVMAGEAEAFCRQTQSKPAVARPDLTTMSRSCEKAQTKGELAKWQCSGSIDFYCVCSNNPRPSATER